MSKAVILIEMEHHEATKALTRILGLLAWASDGYGIRSMTVTRFEDEDHQTIIEYRNARWWERWLRK